MKRLGDSCRDLEALARAYLRAVSAMPYALLARAQSGPWPSVACGAAGAAFALWRTSGRGRARRLSDATQLLSDASRAPSVHLWPRGFGPRRDLDASVAYGRAGLDCARLLVAHAQRDRVTRDRALERYVARCRPRAGMGSELLFGAAGLLNGARAAYASTGDRRLAGAGDALADWLVERAEVGRWGWARRASAGFAHGAAGIFHALLGWYAHAARRPPPSLAACLARFAERTGRPAGLRSWCNGSAGFVLLWVKAYEQTREPEYRALARASARHTMASGRDEPGDLCCGWGGRAFALLSMDRIEPDRGWDARAVDLAHRAAAALRSGSGPWPNGLYKGYPGLVCLVEDIARPREERMGFPLVEG